MTICTINNCTVNITISIIIYLAVFWMYPCFGLSFPDVSTPMHYVHDLKIVNVTLLKNDTCNGIRTSGKTDQIMDTSEKQLNYVTINESYNQFTFHLFFIFTKRFVIVIVFFNTLMSNILAHQTIKPIKR